jgi:antirestriction protein ArdC
MRALLEATGADVRVGGEAAFYVPSADFIQLPDEKHFTQDDAGERTFQFESTAAHELTHYAAFRIMPRAREILREGRTH